MAKRKTWEKSTKFEAERRIEQVAEMLLLGTTRSNIIRYVADQWKIQERQADNYIRDARKSIMDSNAFDKEQLIGESIKRRELLIRRNFASGDLREVRVLQDSLDDRLGLFREMSGAESGGQVVLNFVKDDRDKAT